MFILYFFMVMIQKSSFENHNRSQFTIIRINIPNLENVYLYVLKDIKTNATSGWQNGGYGLVVRFLAKIIR